LSLWLLANCIEPIPRLLVSAPFCTVCLSVHRQLMFRSKIR
jgi:hypothetical protein